MAVAFVNSDGQTLDATQCSASFGQRIEVSVHGDAQDVADFNDGHAFRVRVIFYSKSIGLNSFHSVFVDPHTISHISEAPDTTLQGIKLDSTTCLIEI